MEEVDELFERKAALEDRINEFFGDEYLLVNVGDRGYQDLLQQLEEVNEELNELMNYI